MEDPHESKVDGHDARIAAMEVHVKTVHTALHEFKDDVDSKFANITGLIQSIRSEISTSNRTQWPGILAGIGVLLVIVGFIGNGYVRDQERTEDDVAILQEKFQRHESANGIHYSLREQVLNNANTVKDNLRTHEAQVLSLDQDIDNIRVWQEKHAESSQHAHTKAEEKIWALERKVFGK